MKYDSHFDHLSKGAIIRSRATWYEKGEKNKKYFLGLESHRGKKGCIRKIFTSSGHLTSDPKRIMTEVEQFYSDLYSTNAESINVSYFFLHNLHHLHHLKISSYQAMMGLPLNSIKLFETQ